jgi:pimeloyl-ACP methyl ester carboxylesterase
MPTFRRDGVRLHYEARGAGDAVILLHGFTSLGDSWERHGWVSTLVELGFRAICPDARSHGKSDPVFEPAQCTSAALAADVIGLLDHLDLETASLVGFSMGGGIALRVALDAPQRVDRLVVGGVGDAGINGLHDADELAQLADAFSGAKEPDDSAIASRIRRNAELAGNDLCALLPFLRQGGWPAGLTDISPLRVPALVIVAEADEYMPRAETLLTSLAPAETIHLPGLGHHQVMGDASVKQEAMRFLSGAQIESRP